MRIPAEIPERIAALAADRIEREDSRLEYFLLLWGPGEDDALVFHATAPPEEIIQMLTETRWKSVGGRGCDRGRDAK